MRRWEHRYRHLHPNHGNTHHRRSRLDRVLRHWSKGSIICEILIRHLLVLRQFERRIRGGGRRSVPIRRFCSYFSLFSQNLPPLPPSPLTLSDCLPTFATCFSLSSWLLKSANVRPFKGCGDISSILQMLVESLSLRYRRVLWRCDGPRKTEDVWSLVVMLTRRDSHA